MTNAASVTLVGRDLELRQATGVLNTARAQHVAIAVRIDGISGIGKTALAHEISQRAQSSGWLSVFVAAHRIQKMLPYVVARKIISGIVRELGDDGGRYTSGLDAEIAKSVRGDQSKEAIEESLLRLTEAVSLDRPVAIFVDDAQWADRESTALIDRLMQALADRPLVLFYTERGDQNTERTFEFTDESISISELDQDSLEMLARTVLKGAPENVIKTVAQHARGRALDVVTLAATVADPATLTPARAAETLRSLVARDLALLDGKTREFLQICSLISDPIEYPLLKQLWSDDAELIAHIDACSGRYLRQEGDALHFIHAAVAQNIRETLAIEIPYRRKIIDGILRLTSPRFEDYERLVDQAAACGDRALEKTYLERLLKEADQRQALPVAANALERLISLTPFEAATSLPLYSRLSMIYNVLARDNETHRVCMEALNYAISNGVKHGIGQLVASDSFALYYRGERDALRRTIERFDSYLEEPVDRAHLASVKLFSAFCDSSHENFEGALRELKTLGVNNAAGEIRATTFKALDLGRSGDFNAALLSLDQARAQAEESAPLLKIMVDIGTAQLNFLTLGPNHPRVRAAVAALPKGNDIAAYLTALSLLANGNASDALEFTAEALVHFDGTFARRLLLGVAVTAAALWQVPLSANLRGTIRDEAAIVLRDHASGALLPVSSACSLLDAQQQPAQARALLWKSIDAISTGIPIEPMIVLLPIVLVRTAVALQDEAALEKLAAGLPHDLLPFNVAQHRLAELAAQIALHRRVEDGLITRLRGELAELGAPSFGDLLGSLKGEHAAQASAKGKLTRREHEVAGFVAEGLTNREIAEKLVLSERTVEAHIANIFSKLSASSRAQVASWYARLSLTKV